jgi:hypothetical protein
VTPRVQQDVRESVPHLAWRPQDVEVVPVGEHATAKSEDPVHGSRKARSDRLHAPGQVFSAGGFHDRVEVIRLDRVVSDAKPAALARCAQASLELSGESRVT